MKKNPTSGFIAYKRIGDEIFVYLQMRTKDAPHNPGMYGIFGGSLEENESHEEALVREIKEELDITLTEYHLFGKYEETVSIMNLFYLEVSDDFESKVTVLEGQYGKFISENDIEQNNLILDVHKKILFMLLNTIRN